METLLTARLLCSTGLAFRCGTSTLLVDVLNGSYGSFYRLPRETAAAIISGAPPYDCVDGLVYSHLHPDHYDQADNAAFLRTHPGVPAFFPTIDTPPHGVLRMGDFTVEYQYLEHAPCDYTWAKHYVLLLSAGETTVYLTTDAALDPAAHLAFLAGRQADYGFWNAMYLSRPETRRLLRRCARKTYIYHMPLAAGDTSGICRKAAQNFRRHGDELAGVTVLGTYPQQLLLPHLG